MAVLDIIIFSLIALLFVSIFFIVLSSKRTSKFWKIHDALYVRLANNRSNFNAMKFSVMAIGDEWKTGLSPSSYKIKLKYRKRLEGKLTRAADLLGDANDAFQNDAYRILKKSAQRNVWRLLSQTDKLLSEFETDLAEYHELYPQDQ